MHTKEVLPFSWEILEDAADDYVVVFFQTLEDAEHFDREATVRFENFYTTATYCFHDAKKRLVRDAGEMMYVAMFSGNIHGWHGEHRAYELHISKPWYLYDPFSRQFATANVEDLI